MKKIWMVGAFAILAAAAMAGNPPPNYHHKNPVPEPASMIVLGMGAAMLIRRMKKS